MESFVSSNSNSPINLIGCDQLNDLFQEQEMQELLASYDQNQQLNDEVLENGFEHHQNLNNLYGSKIPCNDFQNNDFTGEDELMGEENTIDLQNLMISSDLNDVEDADLIQFSREFPLSPEQVKNLIEEHQNAEINQFETAYQRHMENTREQVRAEKEIIRNIFEENKLLVTKANKAAIMINYLRSFVKMNYISKYNKPDEQPVSLNYINEVNELLGKSIFYCDQCSFFSESEKGLKTHQSRRHQKQ